MENNVQKCKYNQEFRKDFRKCMKALLLSEPSEKVNAYLDKLSTYAKQHELYQLSYKSFLNAFPNISEDAKNTITDVFQQGVNCGVVLILSLLINNTGYFADCVFDEDNDNQEHQTYKEKKEKIKKL